MTSQQDTDQNTPTNTLEEDITQILANGYFKSHVFKTSEDAELWQSDIRLQLTDRTRNSLVEYVSEAVNKAEGKARVEVISAFKDWADAVEITYNQVIEEQLKIVRELTKTNTHTEL